MTDTVFIRSKQLKTKEEYVIFSKIDEEKLYEFETVEDAIWEIAEFILEIENITFLTKLYEAYKQEIELAYLKIPTMIISSIEKQYQKNLQITFFIDKIRILELIWDQCGWGASAAVQFSELLNNLLQQPPLTNILANTYTAILFD